MNYIAIWRSIFCTEAVGVTDYSNILKLVKLTKSENQKNYIEQKRSGKQSTNEVSKSKK